MNAVQKSYQYCREVARTRARNFYYSFVLLPSTQRDAMCAMYAFMRYCDDLSDEPGATRAAIECWREDLNSALKGRFTGHPVWPAFHDAVNAYGIRHHYFHEIINGVESDLEARVFHSFADLYGYCYQVASVVGMTTIHIFGFDSPQALPLAEKCGIAFQLTNILRDIREDVERGRIYLPAEDLERFGVSREDLEHGNRNRRFLDLMRFETERARAYYAESKPLIGMVHARSRPSLRALIAIYSGLLDRIEQSEYDVFSKRVRLSAIEKSWAVLRALAPR